MLTMLADSFEKSLHAAISNSLKAAKSFTRPAPRSHFRFRHHQDERTARAGIWHHTDSTTGTHHAPRHASHKQAKRNWRNTRPWKHVLIGRAARCDAIRTKSRSPGSWKKREASF